MMKVKSTAAVRRFLVSRYRRWHGVARLAGHAGGRLLAGALLLNLVTGLLPISFVIWIGVMLGHVGSERKLSAVALAFGLAIGSFVLQQLLAPFQAAVGDVVARHVDGYCIQRLASAALVGTPLKTLERTQVSRRLSDARAGFDRQLPTPGEAVAGAIALVARYSQLLGAVVVVWVVLSPVVALIVATAALTVRFGQRGSLARFGALWLSLAPARQRAHYLRLVGASPAATKDIRVLGILPWYRQRHDRDTHGYLASLWSGRRRILMRPFLGYALAGLFGAAAALLLLAHWAGGGALPILRLSIAVQAIVIPIRFGVFFPESDVQTQYGLAGYEALGDFEAMAATAQDTVPQGELSVTARPRDAIRCENVVFRYGEDASPVLDGLNLTIPAGQATAIVGLNGAGKTTLVKLLTRLYDPESGRITVDGQDLRQYRPADWQRQIAVVFQDFIHYELDAAANIDPAGAGSGPDQARMIAQAAQRAGAAEVLGSLPHGLATVLSRQYPNGTDLSGGQWQRIALTRAFHAADRGASVLILDEPTAQFDVRAEVAFFDQFIEMTRGITSVIVSHRFSTVRRADQIIVLSGGQVVEQGDHDTLLAAGGEYARLFQLQARRFGTEESDESSEDTPAAAEVTS
jgi:ATP-binding cassette subfamily B protein